MIIILAVLKQLPLRPRITNHEFHQNLTYNPGI